MNTEDDSDGSVGGYDMKNSKWVTVNKRKRNKKKEQNNNFGTNENVNKEEDVQEEQGAESEDDKTSGSDTCKGGPGKVVCGEPVEDGVLCDSCGSWFHALCQIIPTPAVIALKKYKALSWLCDVCKLEITTGNVKGDHGSSKVGKQLEVLDRTVREHMKLVEPVLEVRSEFKSLWEKVEQLEGSLRNHTRLVESSMREQERSAEDQVRLLKRSFQEQSKQKMSYADMLKSTCTNVIKEVNTKLDAMPKQSAQGGETNAVHADISSIFDNYLDKDKRKLNVVVHNLPEESGITLAERSSLDQAAFLTVVREGLKLRVHTTKSFRVGKQIPERPRLLIVTIDNLEAKKDLLSMASQLKDTKWKNIYINPDLTKQEREEGKKLRAELLSRRQAGEANLTIRRGRVVILGSGSSDRDSAPQPQRAAHESSGCGLPEQNPKESRYQRAGSAQASLGPRSSDRVLDSQPQRPAQVSLETGSSDRDTGSLSQGPAGHADPRTDARASGNSNTEKPQRD